jgi:prevent-host-death family protein
MQSLGIYEAKSKFSALIELVEQGEEVRITRHGKEVVRMLPVRRRPVISDEQIARELGQIAALHATITPGAVAAAQVPVASTATMPVTSLRRTGRSMT